MKLNKVTDADGSDDTAVSPQGGKGVARDRWVQNKGNYDIFSCRVLSLESRPLTRKKGKKKCVVRDMKQCPVGMDIKLIQPARAGKVSDESCTGRLAIAEMLINTLLKNCCTASLRSRLKLEFSSKADWCQLPNQTNIVTVTCLPMHILLKSIPCEIIIDIIFLFYLFYCSW